MTINHLIFDLGNTLIDFNLHLVSQGLSGRFNRQEEEIYDFLFKSEFFVRFEKGDIGPDELVTILNAKFQDDLDVDSFDRIFSPIFNPRPQMISLIEILKDRYEISLLSNTNALHRRYLEGTYPFLKSFDSRFYSFALRVLKPQPEIFHEVLSRTNSVPEECLFIDDLKMHTEGAERIGISAIHFQGEEHLQQELVKRGIL